MRVIDGGVTAPMGFMAQGVCADIKKKGKKDVAVIYSSIRCTAAGVFTVNNVRASSVDISKRHLEDGFAQAIVVNSGNANACTGTQGISDTMYIAQLTGQLLGIPANDIIVASTGVIGVPLPRDNVAEGIKKSVQTLSNQGSSNAAEAIMTTDLISKEIAVEVDIGGKVVTIGGIAKGSGMIHPNMATMLAFLTTDAAISSKCLKRVLKESCDQSFNMISVDRETSTNDMAVVLANGVAGNPCIEDTDSEGYRIFKEAFDYVNASLAKMIARDGEGATCLIEVRVINAVSLDNARLIARSIVGSNLTKAAIFGRDANWGRILAAAGYSQAKFDLDKVDIYIGEEKMAENGMGLQFNEEKARQELEKDPVVITIDLKSGNQCATAWGCDLSYDYIRINAAYRS
ncbi:MAG: bifunctional glutamate N-acetyltransferase/amino-acid acetyltransferase ArgJ [Syntrophomonadaceae bacterium]